MLNITNMNYFSNILLMDSIHYDMIYTLFVSVYEPIIRPKGYIFSSTKWIHVCMREPRVEKYYAFNPIQKKKKT